jgi:hypothetical protein
VAGNIFIPARGQLVNTDGFAPHPTCLRNATD